MFPELDVTEKRMLADGFSCISLPVPLVLERTCCGEAGSDVGVPGFLELLTGSSGSKILDVFSKN